MTDLPALEALQAAATPTCRHCGKTREEHWDGYIMAHDVALAQDGLHCPWDGATPSRWEYEPGQTYGELAKDRDSLRAELDRVRGELTEAQADLEAMVEALPRCEEPHCLEVGTVELMGGTEGSWFRCDKHYLNQSHWGVVRDCTWAPVVRNLSARKRGGT